MSTTTPSKTPFKNRLQQIDLNLVAKCCVVFLLVGMQLQTSIRLGGFLQHDNNHLPPTSSDNSTLGTPLHSSSSSSIIHETTPRHHYNFTAAICALVVDAEFYLVEWIDYHLALGFDEIFLYDNSPKFELKQWYRNTRHHPLYHKVHINHLPGKSWVDDYEDYGGYVQNAAYTHCITTHGKRFPETPKRPPLKLKGSHLHKNRTKHEYMALIDLDEFIVLKQYPMNHTIIHDVLVDYLLPYGGALTMNWQLFGTSNKSTYSPIPLLKRNVHRDVQMESVIKTIVQSTDFNSVKNPHAVTVRKGTQIRTTLFPGALYSYQNSGSKTGATDGQYPSSVMVVHHYRYGSLKEYTQKACFRGEVIGSIKGCNPKTRTLDLGNWPQHVRIRSGEVYDDRAWKYLTDRVPQYKVYDDPKWHDYF